jgi:hypothetical protein
LEAGGVVFRFACPVALFEDVLEGATASSRLRPLCCRRPAPDIELFDDVDGEMFLAVDGAGAAAAAAGVGIVCGDDECLYFLRSSLESVDPFRATPLEPARPLGTLAGAEAVIADDDAEGVRVFVTTFVSLRSQSAVSSSQLSAEVGFGTAAPSSISLASDCGRLLYSCCSFDGATGGRFARTQIHTPRMHRRRNKIALDRG